MTEPIRQFDWDDEKDEECRVSRGFGFFDVLPVFNDPAAIVETDDRRSYGETRYRLIGSLGHLTFVIVYTERNGITRIISVRLANRRERVRYGKGRTLQ